jgi:hypothetical protein
MSMTWQTWRRALRLLMGGAALYALLLQITLAALAGAPAGLDVASSLCITEHATTQNDAPGKAITHDCICAGLCHAGVIAPPSQAMRVTRASLTIAYAHITSNEMAPQTQRAFSARGPPLSV